MKELVVITGSGVKFPQENASTNRLIEVAKGFVNLQYNVLLIPFTDRKGKQLLSNGEYEGIPYLYMDNNKYIFKKLNYTIQLCRFIYNKRNNMKYVFCGSTGNIKLFLISLFCRILGIIFIFDLVEEKFSTWKSRKLNELSFKQLIHKMTINLIEIFFFYLFVIRSPAYITYINHNFNKIFKFIFISRKKIFYLPILKYIEDNFDNSNKINKDLKLRKNTIVHSGSMFLSKDGIFEIMEAIKILKEKYEINFIVEFYGPINESVTRLISKFVEQNNLNGLIRIKGLVDRKTLYDKQRTALAVICFKQDIAQNRFNFATKLIDYMVSKRPIILSDLDTYYGFFENSQNAIIVNPKDSEMLAQKIYYLYNNSVLANSIGIKGYELLRKTFNSKVLIYELDKMMQAD